MNHMSRIVLALALWGAVCSPRPLWAQSSSWDTLYNSDVLPTSPLLGDTAWLPHWGNSNSDLSTADGILHMVTQTPGSAWFTQPSERYSVSRPLTVECRVRVVSAEPQWPYSFAVAIGATKGARGFIGLFSDRIAFFTDDTTTAS